MAEKPAPDGDGPGIDCPVCRTNTCSGFLSAGGRDYLRCETCQAVFLNPGQLPSAQEERDHYTLHENDPGDPRYRAFLARLAEPLMARLKPGSRGLDYGSGPGPALAAMLREAGHEMMIHDPFFPCDEDALHRTYEFITCTETAEHFHRPWEEFQRLDALLEPGGVLGLMTCFRTDDHLFETWHYRHDPTHVVFYKEETLRFLAAQLGWDCEIPRKDVAIMRKPS